MRDYVILDVFTRRVLEGNPVAVFLDGSGLDTATMQRTARELNLSETVFLCEAGEGGADAAVRIFTPGAELPFAGHPVLGTAFVVGERSGASEVVLACGAGPVRIVLEREGGEIVYGEMEQPVPAVGDAPDVEALLAALGVKASQLPVSAWRNGPTHVYVQLDSSQAVDALAPDMGALARILDGGVSCYAVEDSTRVHARVFVPGLGVPEDPATGSAAGPLAVHLAMHGAVGWGEQIEIHQGMAMGRPSLLRARAFGGPERIERVLVGGGAVRVAEGRYRLS